MNTAGTSAEVVGAVKSAGARPGRRRHAAPLHPVRRRSWRRQHQPVAAARSSWCTHTDHAAHAGAVAAKPCAGCRRALRVRQSPAAASLSPSRNANASGPNSMDRGTATAPICSTAMQATAVSRSAAASRWQPGRPAPRPGRRAPATSGWPPPATRHSCGWLGCRRARSRARATRRALAGAAAQRALHTCAMLNCAVTCQPKLPCSRR